ncbi:uncharacterized protein LOC115757551 isoform X2 [Rhodamnia argentea]|uniref:Uncharacterized protein LOC115757551 isoform X2 n=1 Tax=Rhodamnia argentea TaxID=178133 RepID=A0A8B8R2L4_9MYRT|nr:uncharacterized protein LOC115757551 isoform X2 [Rhodamnia argentea]
MEVEVGLGAAAKTFRLEKAVCSHGLFMTCPNRWDPLSLSLSRPLRLPDDDVPVMVRISHPPRSASLRLLVHGVSALSPSQHHSLLRQVRRMLRLSDEDERKASEFEKMCGAMREAPDCVREFGGRVFRSPTLFEDMVKCILLCNCQWSRTLSMAQALCELQLELQRNSSNSSCMEDRDGIRDIAKGVASHLAPTTPAAKEARRKGGRCKTQTNLMTKFADVTPEAQIATSTGMEAVKLGIDSHKIHQLSSGLSSSDACSSQCDHQSRLASEETCETSEEDRKRGAREEPIVQIDHVEECWWDVVGNFPSPRELASLDEGFLAKRCNLGYRAGRIVKLSQGIVEGRINLNQLEEICDTRCLSSYADLTERLRQIHGFGPFTCANVLMCMGFYHAIPTDSETMRHLQQVHGKNSTIQTAQSDVEDIYGRAELWNFYGERFGNLSAMPLSNYKLITATNMKKKGSRGKKRRKLSS